MVGESAPGGIQSVLNALSVLEEVAVRQPVGVSELSRATDMPKSSVQRSLVTLRQAGWLRVVDEERARWGLTTKPLSIGLRGAAEDGLRDAALPAMAELNRETNEAIHLAVRDGDALIIVARKDSTQPVRTFVEVGTRAPLHGTACGIAILAKLAEPDVTAVLDGKLDSYTDTTITDPKVLRKEIAATRKRGYSVNVASWWRPQVAAVGAAIVAASQEPIAAFAISVPSSRFDSEKVAPYGALVVEAAEKVSSELKSI